MKAGTKGGEVKTDTKESHLNLKRGGLEEGKKGTIAFRFVLMAMVVVEIA